MTEEQVAISVAILIFVLGLVQIWREQVAHQRMIDQTIAMLKRRTEARRLRRGMRVVRIEKKRG